MAMQKPEHPLPISDKVRQLFQRKEEAEPNWKEIEEIQKKLIDH